MRTLAWAGAVRSIGPNFLKLGVGKLTPSLIMKRTIAIVGFSNLTLPYLLARDLSDVEIWTMNHAFVLGEEKIPRIDRLYEIHKKEWFLRKELPSAQEYWEWLTQPHDFPIYMQEVDPAIPSSARYPYDEIVEDIFTPLKRGVEINPYFTSSVSFMLAHAIYERVDRIEIYGIEMATGTEYAYQKPGGEFMIGAAIARGIEVVLHPLSELCKARLYGYDLVPNIALPRTQELLSFYQQKFEEHKARMLATVEQYNQSENKDKDAVLELTAYTDAYYGAITVLERLMGESDYYLGRQNLERQATTYRSRMEYHKAITNMKRSEFNATQDPKIWKEYLDARATMYANMGATQVVEKLIDECDMVVIKPELVLTIQEKE